MMAQQLIPDSCHNDKLTDVKKLTTPDINSFGPLRLVIIQATPYCNLDCDYCYLPDRSNKKQLSLKLITPIFHRLLTSSFTKDTFTVCWHAGEPLTVPLSFYQSAFEIIKNLELKISPKNPKITYSIQTNGTLINQAWCDLFTQYPVKIGVSLDGPDFIHNSYRKTRTGLGSHAGTMRGIKLLQQNELDFQIIAVLTATSLDYPDEIFQFFRDHNINKVAFNIEEIEGINHNSSLKINEHRKRVHSFFQRFWELTTATKGSFQVREFEQISSLILTGKLRRQNQLSHPFSTVSIDSQGNFSTFSPELLAMPSRDYGNFILGNFQQDSLESICTTEKFQRIYHDIFQGVTKCQNSCDYFSLCGGGAPSNKYWENKTFISTETMACQYNKQIIADIVLQGIENYLGL